MSCTICLDILNNPVLLECGHIFCAGRYILYNYYIKEHTLWGKTKKQFPIIFDFD